MKSWQKTLSGLTFGAALLLTTGLCTVPAVPAQAIGLGDLGTVIQAGVSYAKIDKALNYYENDGRNEYMEQVKKQYGVNETPEANEMLEQIMTKLSGSIAAVDPAISAKPYNYFVNNETSFNAFCTLGHNLSVNIGAFDVLNYNEDELAVVIAHELGHGQKQHPLKGNRKSLTVAMATEVLSGGSASVAAKLAYNIGRAKLITKPQEVEADELAFTYYTGAGYNIGAGAAVWERVLEKSSSSTGVNAFVGDLLNDHPTNVSRLAKYNQKITDWSGGAVKVDDKTGALSVNGKAFYTPVAASGLSAKERAYFIAGNLAAVYHNKQQSGGVSSDGSVLYIGEQPILTAVDGESLTDLQSKLQGIL